jgi:hypothetical protein
MYYAVYGTLAIVLLHCSITTSCVAYSSATYAQRFDRYENTVNTAACTVCGFALTLTQQLQQAQ